MSRLLPWMLALLTVACAEEESKPIATGPDAFVYDQGPVDCLTDTDCAANAPADPCRVARCVQNVCVEAPAAAGVACTDPGTPLGTCRASACDGAGACGVIGAPDGTPCGAADACSAWVCGQGLCRRAPVAPWGSPCGAADACIAMRCIGIECQAVPLQDCNDGNVCTDDACDPASGCVHSAVTGDCDDGDACTAPDTCDAGQCKGGAFTCECATDQDCLDQDNDLCDGLRRCVENACVDDPAHGPVTCTDPGNLGPCEKAACDPADGQCKTGIADGAPCTDGDDCTIGDYCGGSGSCLAGIQLDCTGACAGHAGCP